jgi:cbb3-type cytochrome oxidase subunit 3
VNGNEVFPIISLVMFTLFFAGVLLHVLSMNRRTADEMSGLPLDGPGDEKANQNA